MSPTLYQSDSRISNHRGHKFPPSQTLHSTRSDARAKFDSGVIFLNQVKFFVCIDNRLRQMAFFVFVKVGAVGKSRLSSVERFRNKKKKFFSVVECFLCLFVFYYIKEIDSMLPCVCSVIDHRRLRNVVRTLVTHSAIASSATFLFLPHFDVICDLLVNRSTAKWNLFAKYTSRKPIQLQSCKQKHL